jgi:hypothetical protein
MPEPEEIDPGTPMADVNPADLVDLGPEGCGLPQ